MDGTELYGRWSIDKACPVKSDANGCNNTFEFVSIITSSGLDEEEAGVLGMWSGNHSYATASQMFMTEFDDDSDVSEKTFSFYMTGLDGESYIDFGTPNTAVMDGSPIYISIESSNLWWSAALTGFRWDSSMDDQNEYAISEGDYALTDTGSSCIIGPPEAGVILRNIISRFPKVYEDNGWGYIFDCPADYSDYPSFELLYGGYWFEVKAEDYIIQLTEGGTCGICISSSEDTEEWILGDAFMRGYYNIHDHDNLRMGFVPFSGSSKSVPESASSTPSGSLSDVTLDNVGRLIFGLMPGTFFLLLAIVLIPTLCCCGLLWYCFFVAAFLPSKSVLARGKRVLQKAAEDSTDSSVALIYLK